MSSAQRKPIRRALAAEAISLTMSYPPVHHLDVFRYADGLGLAGVDPSTHRDSFTRHEAVATRRVARSQRTRGLVVASVFAVRSSGERARALILALHVERLVRSRRFLTRSVQLNAERDIAANIPVAFRQEHCQTVHRQRSFSCDRARRRDNSAIDNAEWYPSRPRYGPRRNRRGRRDVPGCLWNGGRIHGSPLRNAHSLVGRSGRVAHPRTSGRKEVHPGAQCPDAMQHAGYWGDPRGQWGQLRRTGGVDPNVQLPSDGIGVTEGANCGQPAGLVGPGETLTLKLGAFLPPDVAISAGELRIGKSRVSDGNLLVAYDNPNDNDFGEPITVSVGGQSIDVDNDGNGFKSISIRSTATQSSRGLSLRSKTVFTLVAPPAAPGAPTNVQAVRGNAQATISWEPPASTGGSDITNYVLRYYPTDSPSTTKTTVDPAETPETVLGLTNGREYTFEVSAVNGVGEGTSATTTATPAATAPGAPTNVQAVRGNAQATISWEPPASTGGSDITNYVLRYYPTNSPSTTKTVDPAETPETVLGLTNGREYTFEVSAVNGVGEGTSATTTATPMTGLVDCTDALDPVLGESGDIATRVVFFRGENDPRKQDVDVTCEEVKGFPDPPDGFTDFVFWDNETNNGTQKVNATVTIEWAPTTIDKAGKPTLIDYDGYGPGPFTDSLWCPSFTSVTIDSKVFYTATMPALPPGTVGANADGTAPWCVVSRTEVVSDSTLIRTDVFFGSGDPRGALR